MYLDFLKMQSEDMFSVNYIKSIKSIKTNAYLHLFYKEGMKCSHLSSTSYPIKVVTPYLLTADRQQCLNKCAHSSPVLAYAEQGGANISFFLFFWCVGGLKDAGVSQCSAGSSFALMARIQATWYWQGRARAFRFYLSNKSSHLLQKVTEQPLFL